MADISPGLGTLATLPRELRDQIYDEIGGVKVSVQSYPSTLALNPAYPFVCMRATCRRADLLRASKAFSAEYAETKAKRNLRLLLVTATPMIINTRKAAKKPLTQHPLLKKVPESAKDATLRFDESAYGSGFYWTRKQGWWDRAPWLPAHRDALSRTDGKQMRGYPWQSSCSARRCRNCNCCGCKCG
jgi:hypothetical protein